MKQLMGIIGMAAVAVLLMGGAFGVVIPGTQAIARTYWPEKEGVPSAPATRAVTQDSCAPSSAFHLPTHRSAAC